MPRWLRLVRLQDFVWVLLFAGLLVSLKFLPAPVFDTDPGQGDLQEIIPLAALGIAQILEPRFPAVATTRSRIFWIVLKIVLGFVFIGFTGSINSPYSMVLLLPVVSAATTFGPRGTLAFMVLASGFYLYFFLHLHGEEVQANHILPVIFLGMIGTSANILAEQLRVQSEKHRRTAEQLSAANVQIREAQEAVARSDRLAALGQLSAGLAHELRNPLGTIKASAEMLNHNISRENEIAREVAGFISSEVDRANSLITRFLQFARPLELQLATADLSQTIDRAIALVEREASGIAIYRNYAPEMAPFQFDAELMERVFYNLVLNAVQATAPGGTVTVKTRAAVGTAEVAVIDRGVGIDAKHIETIFNPFFTTKPEGVGLGLAIVSKIVDEHGGKITVESELGKGSIFRVLLPMERMAKATQA
ncbi:Signal transduction histidine kinase, nitrogen specific, NtrB [Candidatus Sulfopaludibacter sp. SbA4]|nr:Signal transduction histidine kinase, nitrogen specific, NtrB [Candidatus Sulfopaludibacter sp. SbA4]